MRSAEEILKRQLSGINKHTKRRNWKILFIIKRRRVRFVWWHEPDGKPSEEWGGVFISEHPLGKFIYIQNEKLLE